MLDGTINFGFDLDLVFVDCETTSLSRRTGAVTSIWGQRRRGVSLDLVAEAGGLVVVPEADLRLADQGSLEIGHYDEERWRREARPWPVVWAEFLERLIVSQPRPWRWVGHNVAFDLAMIDAMHARHGTTAAPPAGRQCTKCDAYPLRAAGVVSKVSLEALAAHFGLRAQDHTARGDVELLVAVYRKLYQQGGE